MSNTTSATIKATLHRYKFDTSIPEQAQEWSALQKTLIASGVKCFNVIADPREKGTGWPDNGATQDSLEVNLDITHIFNDQWNTETHRIHDWYLAVYPNKRIQSGHWLELTHELHQLRQQTSACGYCGALYGPYHNKLEDRFCTKCLGSAHLKLSELHLLRLVPLSEPWGKERGPLSDKERAILEPKYVEAQTEGSKTRAAAQRERELKEIHEEFEKTTAAATEKRDGLLWIWNKGCGLDNVIYYNHTRTFCFGWRQAITSGDVHQALIDLLKDFPFKWEIKLEKSAVEGFKQPVVGQINGPLEGASRGQHYAVYGPSGWCYFDTKSKAKAHSDELVGKEGK